MSLLKAVGPPGSLGFLAVSIAIGLILLYGWPRRRGLAYGWLLAVAAGYLLLSWPPAARTIVASLDAPAPTVIGTIPPLDVLLVLDGDNRRSRARVAERVVETSPPPAAYVIGSRLILREMSDAMLNAVTHYPAGNTREQMAWVKEFVAGHAAHRVAVLVSTLQAPRVARLASSASLSLVVIASPLDTDLPTSGARRLLPSCAALAASRDALYEHAALVYYRWRGWL